MRNLISLFNKNNYVAWNNYFKMFRKEDYAAFCYYSNSINFFIFICQSRQ